MRTRKFQRVNFKNLSFDRQNNLNFANNTNTILIKSTLYIYNFLKFNYPFLRYIIFFIGCESAIMNSYKSMLKSIVPLRNFLFWTVAPKDDATGAGLSASPRTPCTERLYPPYHTMLWRAVPRCGTVCRAILSRVAWLVVSFLYSFVGKSAASLVFKRRAREGGEERWQ